MQSATILVADDDADFVEITRTILESEGYRVLTAANGEQALARVSAERPDLLLLDVMMSSVLDGVDLSHQLARDPDARYLPIIIVSSIASTPQAALLSTEDVIHMDAWLSKPVGARVLLNKVAELLS